MSWLKQAAGNEIDVHIWKKPGDESMTDLFTISEGKTAICVDLPIDQALESLREHMEMMSKEGSVVDNPQMQRDDENAGLNGLFDEQHVTHEPDQSVDPGPASVTPGANTPVAPGVFEY